MTPDERQLIAGLFDRMRQNGAVEKDREAESFINQSARQTPDSAYLLVQSVLAQEHYLQQAAGRIEELEARLRDLEDEMQRLSQPAPQRSGGGSFLGGIFGGQKAQPQPAARSSVPAAGGRAPTYGEAGSPWGQQPQRAGGYQAGGAQGGAWGQQPMQPQAPAGGGGFMRSALTTAAGVAGGMLAANAISNMMRGGSEAQAAGGNTTTPASTGETSPYAVDNAADKQREADWAQDAAQDAEEQGYADDSSSDSDWGGADDSEY